MGELAKLTRPNTPHREPAVLAAAVGIEATTIIAQIVLAAAIVRCSGPPIAAGPGIAERTKDVVPTKYRGEDGAVACNSDHFV